MNWITQIERQVPLKLVLVSATILLTSGAKRAQAADPIEVRLVVPDDRPGCAGDEFFLREFYRALGPTRPAIMTKSRIDARIDEIEPDTFQLDLRVLPLWGKAMQLPAHVYGPPTECSKVVAYAADIAATVLSAPSAKDPKAPGQPPMSYVFAGLRASHGLSPQLVSLGPVAGGGMLLSREWAAEFSLAMTPPFTWRTKDDRPVEIRFGGAASIALCYQFRQIELCPKVTLGGYDGSAPFLKSAVENTSTHYLTAGLEMHKNIQLSPTTKLRFGANIAVTSIVPAFQIYDKLEWVALPITTTWEIVLLTR